MIFSKELHSKYLYIMNPKTNEKMRQVLHRFSVINIIKAQYIMLKSLIFVHFSLYILLLVNLFHYICPLDLKKTNTK